MARTICAHFAMTLEAFLLYAHLGGVIVWSASALGAYWLVLVAGHERAKAPADPEIARRDEWVRRRFLEVVWLEHIALVVLVASGLWRAQRLGFDWNTLVGAESATWLRWKLILVAAVVIPFEVYDVWLSHWHLPRLLRREAPGSPAIARAWTHHDRFMWIGGAILMIAIPLIMGLAVFRPA